MKKIIALALAALLSLSMVAVFSAADERDDLIIGAGGTHDGAAAYIVPKSTTKIMLGVLPVNYAINANLDRAAANAIVTNALAIDGVKASLLAFGKAQGFSTADKFLEAYYTGKWTAANAAEAQTILDWVRMVELSEIFALDSNTVYDGALINALYAKENYDDGYLKFSPKITKGGEYISSYDIKSSATKELYLEIKAKENYFGGLKDVEVETKVTFSKPSKIIETGNYNKLFGITGTPVGVATDFGKAYLSGLKTNDYFYDTRTFKYGWGPVYDLNASTADTSFSAQEIITGNVANTSYVGPVAYKFTQYRIDHLAVAPGYDVPGSYKGSASNYVHFKKGKGEIYDFDFDTAYFEVKLEDNAEFNLYYTTAALKDVINAYPDVDFQFFCFKGKPAFDYTAKVELYTDEDEVGDEPFLYIWDGAALTPVKADFEDGTFYVNSRQLGEYVVSSEEIKAEAATTAAESTQASTPSTKNPDTGVSDFVGVAVALALVSVAAAGAVALKK